MTMTCLIVHIIMVDGGTIAVVVWSPGNASIILINWEWHAPELLKSSVTAWNKKLMTNLMLRTSTAVQYT